MSRIAKGLHRDWLTLSDEERRHVSGRTRAWLKAKNPSFELHPGIWRPARLTKAVLDLIGSRGPYEHFPRENRLLQQYYT